jgi:hypothetical protein
MLPFQLTEKQKANEKKRLQTILSLIKSLKSRESFDEILEMVQIVDEARQKLNDKLVDERRRYVLGARLGTIFYECVEGYPNYGRQLVKVKTKGYLSFRLDGVGAVVYYNAVGLYTRNIIKASDLDKETRDKIALARFKLLAGSGKPEQNTDVPRPF